MRRIFLVGYMGSGKTTLGIKLAQHLGLEFIDLDVYIEGRYHKSISQIFKEKGEEKFRELERNVLHEVSEFDDTVISCGGGTPCFFDNMDFMYANGITVYLDASLEALVRRLSVAKMKRPLIADKSDDELRDYIYENVQKREPYYSKAAIRFRADRLENRAELQESVEALAALIEGQN